MQDIERQLANFGLNGKEVRVYMAAMQLGTDTVFNIAEKAEIKRATTYLVLRSLEKKGLVTTRSSSKSVKYSATSPQNLVLQMEYRKRELETALPELMTLYNTEPEKPSIRVFEGLPGMKLIYQEAIEFIKTGQEILFFGDVSHLKQAPALVASWLRESKLSQGNIRELVNNDQPHLDYKKVVEGNGNPNHHIKVLPPDSSPLLNDNAIFGNKLVIFSTQKTFYATVIESAEIMASYKAMFEFAWKAI